jgi:hypothetical protein
VSSASLAFYAHANRSSSSSAVSVLCVVVALSDTALGAVGQKGMSKQTEGIQFHHRLQQRATQNGSVYSRHIISHSITNDATGNDNTELERAAIQPVQWARRRTMDRPYPSESLF